MRRPRAKMNPGKVRNVIVKGRSVFTNKSLLNKAIVDIGYKIDAHLNAPTTKTHLAELAARRVMRFVHQTITPKHPRRKRLPKGWSTKASKTISGEIQNGMATSHAVEVAFQIAAKEFGY